MIPILNMLFRAKKLITSTFIAIFVFVLLFLAIRPDKYEAHMSFLVRNERAEPLVGSDPHQNSMQLPDVSEENLNSEVELLSSSDVLRQVVLNCDLAKGAFGNKEVALEGATRRLSKALKITPVRNSSLINVSYQSSNRDQARNVLAQLAKIYLQKRTNLHTASEAEIFFDAETRQAQDNLKAAEFERSSFLSQNGYEGLPQQVQMGLQYVQDLKGQADGAQASLEETEGRLRQIAADRKVTPERIPTQQRASTNPYAIQQMLSNLVTLENRKTELLTKFKPGDRQVQQTDQEIQDTQKALSRVETMQPQENVSDVNPAWQALDAESNRLNQGRTGLIRRRDQLLAQLKQQEDRLRQMQTDSVRVNDLDRRVRVAADKFDLYQSKAVAAKIADGLDAQQISNVILVSEPVVPAIPEASPFNLFTGFLLALFISLSLGFLSQMLSEKLYGPSEIEEQTGIPVMATLPQRAPAYQAVHDVN
jgi:succinoglycan biosynthesis transport protein ExoP